MERESTRDSTKGGGMLIGMGALFLMLGLLLLTELVSNGFFYGGKGQSLGGPIVSGPEAWLTVSVVSGGGLVMLITGVRQRYRHQKSDASARAD